MTGFLNAGTNPLSRLTIAALEDMGYQVDFNAADAFDIPTTVALTALHAAAHHVCRTKAPKPEILPE